MIVMSYGREEADIAEITYKLLTEAGIRQFDKGSPVMALENPNGIAPIIFPLK